MDKKEKDLLKGKKKKKTVLLTRPEDNHRILPSRTEMKNPFVVEWQMFD